MEIVSTPATNAASCTGVFILGDILIKLFSISGGSALAPTFSLQVKCYDPEAFRMQRYMHSIRSLLLGGLLRVVFSSCHTVLRLSVRWVRLIGAFGSRG